MEVCGHLADSLRTDLDQQGGPLAHPITTVRSTCARPCAWKRASQRHSDEYIDGPGDHVAHVGTADQVNVMLARALRDDTRAAPVRVEMWLYSDGEPREIQLPPSTARSLARWLTVAADKAEGPQY